MDNTHMDILWSRLEAFGSKDRIRKEIYDDVKLENPVFKILAESDPHRLFNLIGGNDFDIEMNNWAFEYEYENYVSNNDLEYNEDDELDWDLEEKSIERALEIGHWYVTGTCIINKPQDVELEFEFSYCDGYLDSIIGHPYSPWQEKDRLYYFNH